MKIILTLLALLYTLSPVDLLPDFIFGLGWLDDFAIWGALWYFFFSPLSKQHRAEFRKRRQGFYKQSQSKESIDKEQAKESRSSSSNEDDPYRVLGIEHNASLETIKSAYRQLANKYHPDKVAHLGEEFRVLAEKRFKDIQHAYQALMGHRGNSN